MVTRLGIDLSGYVKRFIWNNQTRNWDPYPSIEIDICDNYAFCGEFSSCNVDNTPQCGCLKGFVPKKEWEAQDRTRGCARKTVLNLDCKTGVSFYKYSGIKLPDTRSSWFDRTMSLEDCELACLNNCTCTAYTSLNISNGGSGCLVWFGELFNIREYPENGQTIYLRIASSDMGIIFFSKVRYKYLAIYIHNTYISIYVYTHFHAFNFFACRLQHKEARYLYFDCSIISRNHSDRTKPYLVYVEEEEQEKAKESR